MCRAINQVAHYDAESRCWQQCMLIWVHFTLVQNMLVMVPGEMWGFKGRIFGAGTM